MNIVERLNHWCMHYDGKSYACEVPAMVAHILLEHHEIPDPYLAENEWIVYETLKKDSFFETEFTLSEDLFESDFLALRFEGLDTVADIWLNDQHLLHVQDMHRVYEIDIHQAACVGVNRLRIHFTSAIAHALKLHQEDPYYSTSDTVDGFSMVRKAHCQYGWDWGPKLPDMGIFRPVTVVAANVARLKSVYVKQTHHADHSVTLTAEADVIRYHDGNDLHTVLTLVTPAGEVLPAQGNDVASIHIAEPELWWCRGLGDQPLYDLCVQLYSGSVLLDEYRTQVGLRTLTIARTPDEWGESFEFCINGVSVFGMGANYIPEDSLYPRTSPERTNKLLEDCAEANFNCIRVWGGGYFQDDYFYEACDRLGLMVWQDLLFACGVYRLKPGFVEDVVAEVKDNVLRLRNHPSIALWCGNNELEWGWSGWDMGFGTKDSDRADYIKLFEWVLPETMRELDPERFYWLASPSSGGSFDNPNDPDRGDVHYWDVWHRLRPFEDYRRYHFRFCSEFGFESLPSMKTLRSFHQGDEINLLSPVMENHQKCRGGNGKILYYLSYLFRYPHSTEILAYASGVLQAEAIRYGVEHWRANRGRCMGSLYWQLNDCWPVISWSSIDYFGRWKPLHYAARRFYAPLLLGAIEEKGQVSLFLCNESPNQAACSVTWRLLDQFGQCLRESTSFHDAPALWAGKVESIDCTDIACDRAAARAHYLSCVLRVGDQVVSRQTVLFVKPKHFDYPDPKLKIAAAENADGFILTVSAESFAQYVWLEHDEIDFVADDNCFDLDAGETRTLFIKRSDIDAAATIEALQKVKAISAYDIR